MKNKYKTDKQKRRDFSRKKSWKPRRSYVYQRQKQFRNKNHFLIRLYLSGQISEDEFILSLIRKHRNSCQYDYW